MVQEKQLQDKIQDAPFNVELEQQILGSIILNDKILRNIVDDVRTEMFYEKQHQHIFKAMLYLFHKNVGIGYDTLINRLKFKHPNDESILEYVFELRSVYINDIEFENKIELLKDTYQKRVLYNLYLKRLTTPMSGIASSVLVQEIEGTIEGMGVTSNIEVDKFESYIDEWLLYQEDETPVQSHRLGYKMLDEIVLLEDSNLMLIGARPSVGKSAFATNLVKNFCLQGKHPLFVSLEMNKKEFMNRLVANMARVEARKLKRKETKTGAEWAQIMIAKEKISKFKFNFYDKGGMTIDQLLGLCRYLKKKDELDVLVVDYLQLLESNQYKGQKQNQVSYISQKLKQLAMELSIPVVALAQLNRGVVTEGGKPREPHLADLRDSGSLEQDANIVLMLHTDDVDQVFQDHKYIKLFVRKNRDGRLGQINYTYYGDFVEFQEKQWNKDTSSWEVVVQDDLECSIDVENDLPFN